LSDKPKTELIRINRDLSLKLRKAVNDYDFTIRDLVQWILNNVDLDKYSKRLASEVGSEVEVQEESTQVNEREAEEEKKSTDEELAESADDEVENFGKY